MMYRTADLTQGLGFVTPPRTEERDTPSSFASDNCFPKNETSQASAQHCVDENPESRTQQIHYPNFDLNYLQYSTQNPHDGIQGPADPRLTLQPAFHDTGYARPSCCQFSPPVSGISDYSHDSRPYVRSEQQWYSPNPQHYRHPAHDITYIATKGQIATPCAPDTAA